MADTAADAAADADVAAAAAAAEAIAGPLNVYSNDQIAVLLAAPLRR